MGKSEFQAESLCGFFKFINPTELALLVTNSQFITQANVQISSKEKQRVCNVEYVA